MIVGIVKEYNGKFGYIQTNSDMVDFNKKDISNNEELKVGDKVLFRLEQRYPNVLIAKNICKIKLTN